MKIKNYFQSKKVKPACISTPTICLLSEASHEPSVISLDATERQRRVDLIKRGIEIAKVLEAPIVTFGSGFIREEHVKNTSINPREILIDSIWQCLEKIGDITLVIEPEPGMFIETLDDALALIKGVNSKNFKLHLDLCHVFCSEHNYLNAIVKVVPFTRYLHLSDTTDGYNLKIVEASDNMDFDLDFAAYLIYFSENNGFLLIDKQNAIYFYDKPLKAKGRHSIERMVKKINKPYKKFRYIDYNSLIVNLSQNHNEIHTYINSMPGISFAILDKAVPILHYLRSPASNPESNQPIIGQMVCNTLTGKVHFHEIPGNGQVDFAAFFKVLRENHFSGYATLELYHHVNEWKKALYTSSQHLYPFIEASADTK